MIQTNRLSRSSTLSIWSINFIDSTNMQTDLGTIYKLNVHIEGLPGTMDEVDFRCKFWTYRKELTVEKKDMIRLDENNYMAVVDSSRLGRGTIKVQTTVLVPDTDVEGGVRTEIYTEYTDIKVN